jgi:hypothetical protein
MIYTLSAIRSGLPWADLTIDLPECWYRFIRAFVPFVTGRPISEQEVTV